MEDEQKISQETKDKFAEVNAAIAEEEGEAEVEDTTQEKYQDPRNADPALNAEGEVIEEEDGEPEETEEPEEEVEVLAEEEPEGEPEAKADELTLPNRLVQAGHRSGLSDEDIVALGDRAESVLGKMADDVDQRSEEFGRMGRELKTARQTEPVKIEEKPAAQEGYLDDDDRFGQILKGQQKLNERLDTLDQRETKREHQESQREQVLIDTTVNSYCDEKSKDYPEFGEAKALTNAQYVIRNQLYEEAENIVLGARSKGQNIDLPSAMDRAFSIYEGTNAKTTVRSKLVQEAQTRQKQFTSRPTKRKTTETFSSPTQKAQAEYAKAMEAKGFRVPGEDEED